MREYENLQKYVSDYFGDKTKKELESDLFYSNPELFYEIAKYRKYGMPKVFKKAIKKYSVDENLFFFESDLGKKYTGNPRYIYERMIELYPDYTYVWAYDGDESVIPGNPIVVERKSEKYYEYLAKSAVVINNSVIAPWFLREETYFVQTWHGTPYKKLHWDVDLKHHEKGRNTPHFFVKSCGWDLLLSPNGYSTDRFKSCFRYNGKILESGYPANDIFYHKKKYESKRREIREKLGISNDALVYLYAPTWGWRKSFKDIKNEFGLYFDPEQFLESAPKDSTLLVRFHHLSDYATSSDGLPDNVVDVSDWDDAIELMCAADILITDYSSIVFDWYCSKKPVIYYVPDLEEYENRTRGVYFNIENVNCGPICKNEEELFDNLDVRDAPFYKEFYEMFCSSHKGDSSDEVIKFIMNRNKVSTKVKIKNLIEKQL